MTVWDNFFVAEVGASAALAGLIFVGVSINMNRILALPRLPERALQAIIILLGILIVSTVLLVPGQATQTIGLEILVIGLAVWTSSVYLDIGNVRKTQKEFRAKQIYNVSMGQAALLPYIAGGVTTILYGNVGIYWLVPAVVLSFVKAISDAWVLLVEINR